MNTPIQGSASEIIKLAMIRIYQQAPSWLKMCMQIHDELVFEVPVSRVTEAVPLIKSIMEQPVPNFDIPIVAEAAIAHYWGLKQDLKIMKDGSLAITFPKRLPEDVEKGKPSAFQKFSRNPMNAELIRRLELAGVPLIDKDGGAV
jgi:hypothetical protein